MKNDMPLGNIPTRDLMRALLFRDDVTMMRGEVKQDAYTNHWVIKYEGPSHDHPLGCWLVSTSGTFGYHIIDTLEEALDKLHELTGVAAPEEVDHE